MRSSSDLGGVTSGRFSRRQAPLRAVRLRMAIFIYCRCVIHLLARF